MNGLELALLVQRLGEVATVGGDFESPTVSGVPRWLLVRAAEAIEALAKEREYWRRDEPHEAARRAALLGGPALA